MKWITRERVKADRVACPWLVKHLIDEDAEFVFTRPDKVMEEAKRLDAKETVRTLPTVLLRPPVHDVRPEFRGSRRTRELQALLALVRAMERRAKWFGRR